MSQAPTEAIEFPPLPEPSMPREEFPRFMHKSARDLFTADQMHAYLTLDRAARAQTPGEPAGWISVEDARPEFVGEDDTPVWTWDGHQVREDEYGLEWDQPAGPVVGGWVVTGECFQGDTLGTVTHWTPRNPPTAPSVQPATPTEQGVDGENHG